MTAELVGERTFPDMTVVGSRLAQPIPEEAVPEGPTPAQTLADLYRRCSPNGGCPYDIDSIIRVLVGLRLHGAVVATEIAQSLLLPPSTVYGCVLELEDFGLCRWLPEPVLRADYVTAEITGAGMRFLREIGANSHAR